MTDYPHSFYGTLYSKATYIPTLSFHLIRNRFFPYVHWWDQIDEWVFLGALPFYTDTDTLRSMGISAVISLNEPWELYIAPDFASLPDFRWCHLPTVDYVAAPTMEQMQLGVSFLREMRQEGRKTYVHCKAGRGRSACIVMCYLLALSNGDDFDFAKETKETKINESQNKESKEFRASESQESETNQSKETEKDESKEVETKNESKETKNESKETKNESKIRSKLSVDEAFDFIKQKRPQIKLNPTQRKAVEEFYEIHFGPKKITRDREGSFDYIDFNHEKHQHEQPQQTSPTHDFKPEKETEAT